MKKTKLPSVTLAISHNISLTREQRYDLHAGKTIQVVGVQVPVWHQRGFTSEPAIEVFCRYVLHNDPEGGTDISMSSWGYEFNLPQPSQNNLIPEISLEKWRAMTLEEQDEWYSRFPQVPTSKSLLEVEHGGSSCLSFKQKTIADANGTQVNVLHYVHIGTIDALKDSLA